MAGRVKKSGRGRPQIASLTPAKYFDSASARFAGFDVAPNPALTLQILCRCFALVRDVLVFDDLPLIETAETGALGAAKEAATSQRLDSKRLDVSREGSYFYHLNDGLIPGDAGMRHARSNTSGRRHQRSNAVCMSDVLRRVQGPAKVTPDEEPLTCASCAAH